MSVLRIPHTPFWTAPAACPLPPLRTAVSSCSRQPQGRKGGGVPSQDVSGLLWLSGPGAPPRVQNEEPPPCPRRTPLFVYPAAQLAVPRPKVARGPTRTRTGESRRVPVGSAPGYRRREVRAGTGEPEPEGRWAETERGDVGLGHLCLMFPIAKTVLDFPHGKAPDFYWNGLPCPSPGDAGAREGLPSCLLQSRGGLEVCAHHAPTR